MTELETQIFDKLDELMEKPDMYLTYADFDNVFEDVGFDYEGDLSLDTLSPLRDIKSVYIWSGWNQEAADLADKYQKERDLVGLAVSPNRYDLSGKRLNLPLADPKEVFSPGFSGYTEEHWLPVLLVPLDEVHDVIEAHRK